jgi:small subunit ribosomal protein S7
MSRKGRAPKREIIPDPVFGSELVTRTINKIMWDGKKSTAERIFYSAMDMINERTGENALDVYEAALNNIMPVLEVKSRRVGGSNYQVPVEVRPDRRRTLGLRWLINAARNRGERTMAERLAGEILDASKSEGAAVRKKEDTHRMAEANKAFAHYRW